jgi:hypothetical protein
VSDYLVRLLLPSSGAAPLIALGAYMTSWNAVTGENTVSVGATNYTNLAAINRASVTGIGPVLLLFTPEPVILGNITPATPA